MNIKRTPEEEAELARRAAEPSVLKDIGREMFDSENSQIAQGKKALLSRLSNWSDSNIRAPLEEAGYPTAGAVLGGAPNMAGELLLPDSGMDLVPMGRLAGLGAKGLKRGMKIADEGKDITKAGTRVPIKEKLTVEEAKLRDQENMAKHYQTARADTGVTKTEGFKRTVDVDDQMKKDAASKALGNTPPSTVKVESLTPEQQAAIANYLDKSQYEETTGRNMARAYLQSIMKKP